jgi:predicted secreted protein
MTTASTLNAIAVYFIIWWTILFAILPFRVRSQQEVGDVSPGTEPGAPAVFHLGWYLAVNSLVSAVVFAVLWWVLIPLI